jgi:hypothetical protein
MFIAQYFPKMMGKATAYGQTIIPESRQIGDAI